MKKFGVFVFDSKNTLSDLSFFKVIKDFLYAGRVASGLLKIPRGWLCYLAPELIINLKPPSIDDDVFSTLPYTNMTDVYAFG